MSQPTNGLITQVEGKFDSSYGVLAVVSLVVYESILNVDNEVKYFWGSALKLSKWLYFTTRYGSLLQAVVVSIITFAPLRITEFTCRLNYFNVLLVPLLSVDYILALRVVALYSCRKALKSILVTLFIIEAMATVTFASVGAGLAHYHAEVNDAGMSACINEDPSGPEGPIAWGIPLAYETMLTALVIYKAFQLWKESYERTGSTLANILIRDQVIYYIVVIFISIFKIFAFSLTVIPAPVSVSLSYTMLLSIPGTRLLFNMQEAGERDVVRPHGDETSGPSTLAEPEFARLSRDFA